MTDLTPWSRQAPGGSGGTGGGGGSGGGGTASNVGGGGGCDGVAGMEREAGGAAQGQWSSVTGEGPGPGPEQGQAAPKGGSALSINNLLA